MNTFSTIDKKRLYKAFKEYYGGDGYSIEEAICLLEENYLGVYNSSRDFAREQLQAECDYEHITAELAHCIDIHEYTEYLFKNEYFELRVGDAVHIFGQF